MNDDYKMSVSRRTVSVALRIALFGIPTILWVAMRLIGDASHDLLKVLEGAADWLYAEYRL